MVFAINNLCTSLPKFKKERADMNAVHRGMNLLQALCVVAVISAVWPGEARAQFAYYPLTPCRVVDTRGTVSTNGGPALTTATRNFQFRGTCGIPTSAKAVSINVTVTNASAGSWLTIWPSGQAQPFVSTINFDQTSGALANGAIVGLSTNTNDLSVTNAIGGVHVIIDVNGYYQ
jgi:hypothetical protein